MSKLTEKERKEILKNIYNVELCYPVREFTGNETILNKFNLGEQQSYYTQTYDIVDRRTGKINKVTRPEYAASVKSYINKYMEKNINSAGNVYIYSEGNGYGIEIITGKILPAVINDTEIIVKSDNLLFYYCPKHNETTQEEIYNYITNHTDTNIQNLFYKADKEAIREYLKYHNEREKINEVVDKELSRIITLVKNLKQKPL